ncbi:MAG: hypothetical protein M5U18_18595 [Dehalococcoidia bacterium]|nr:hypothetical protein [Dehalococcoidia bacterium]
MALLAIHLNPLVTYWAETEPDGTSAAPGNRASISARAASAAAANEPVPSSCMKNPTLT